MTHAPVKKDRERNASMGLSFPSEGPSFSDSSERAQPGPAKGLDNYLHPSKSAKP